MIGAMAVANAVPYSFVNFTHHGPVDIASQLLVDVTNPGGGQVLFTFSNSGPVASTVSHVYWDDGNPAENLAGIVSLTGSSGVVFAAGALPGSLVWGSLLTPHFVASANLSTDANTPFWLNGINPGESLGVLFNLTPGVVFADVLDDMNGGDLRIGLYGQTKPSGMPQYADSFVNGGRVPDASTTAVLLGVALLGLEGLRRRIAR